MPKSRKPSNSIAFQGQPGAYSHLACRDAFPRMEVLPTASFEDTFAAIKNGRARYAMIPIDNSVAGRVADIYRLIPHSGLYIVGERFQRVNHHLLAPRGATLESVKTVHSHIHALGQCRAFIKRMGYRPIIRADTAGAAAEIAARNDSSEAAIASALAGRIHGLKSLKASIEDAEHNTTRFLILSKKAVTPRRNDGPVITTFVFRVRNVPAALYKAMGGFATNGVNMTKLESYLVGGGFNPAQFYADIEGDPRDRNVRLALEELAFFSDELKILGTYPADPFRYTGRRHETG